MIGKKAKMIFDHDFPHLTVSIRRAIPSDAMGIANVHVDSWRTTYRGIVPDEHLAALSYDKSSERWSNRLMKNDDRYAMFVAEDESGKIIGFADGGPERSGDTIYDGELYAIYLLQAYQRQGIGASLVGYVVRYLLEAQFRSMLVWVLVGNPSRRFYEVLGGQTVREGQIEISGKPLLEIAFGWADLRGLATSLA